MRTLLLFFSLLISLPIFSQNYRTVLVDKEVYFDFKDYSHHYYNNPSRIINTDSFQVVGNDTIVYHQMNQEFDESIELDTIGNNGYLTCYYAVDTGFMGIKTVLETNGIDLFFNHYQDSIFIRTQANLNDTWLFYTDATGNYYEATISNISYDSFLGISDSIKTISLQAKDNLGNNISSPYDTLTIKISKHYGLLEGFNFFKFPHGASVEYGQLSFQKIHLIGLPHLDLGVDNLTAAEIFNFNIGDEFQQLTTINSSPPYETYSLMKINDKSFSLNNDTVYYDIYLKEFEYNPFTSSINIIFDGDTTTSYDISPDNPINTKSLMLDSSNANPLPTLWLQSTDGETKTPEDYHFYTINECVPFPFPSASSWVTYKAGVGVYLWGYSDLWDSYRGDIIYYKKNGVEWGTLITANYLLNTDDLIISNNLKVFPNPTNNLLNFQFTEPINNAEIRIYSSIGQLMTTENVTDTNMQFQVSDWSKGVYFYGIYVEGEVVQQGQVLIKE